jgi:serine/threonine-protein kinase
VLSAGTLIGGRYRLDERLGEGGMGEVWGATHVITRRRVAMKFLKSSTSARTDLHQRLLREARAASVVKHPSVVEVLDVFEVEGGGPVLVMDLLVGETLGAKLAKGGALSVREAAEVLLPVVEAVEAAHAKGIVHRDLKPDNIFLNRSEAGEVTVKVLDFGIAKLTAKEGDAADTGALTETGSIVGTPWYMSPEQCYGEQDIDQRADVWALGVILYECLADVRPVEGASIGQVLKRMLHEGIVPIEKQVPGTSPELAALIGRMLSHGREDRPRDLSEVRPVLAALAGRSSWPTSRGVRVASPVDELSRSAPAGAGESRRHPFRADIDASSHAVPRSSVSPSLSRSRRSFLALVLVALAVASVGIAFSAGRTRREDNAERRVQARPSTPVAAAASPLAALLPETPSETASPTHTIPAASATEPQPGRLAPRVFATRASGVQTGAVRSTVDAGSAAPSSSVMVMPSAEPPQPRTTEGRLFENVPF